MLKVVRDNLISRMCVFLVIFLAGLFVFLVVSSTSVLAASSASIETSVNVKPSLTLNIPTNTITMNLDPATHDFDEQDLTVKVGTNNFTGFKLYVTTPNNATDLINVADSSKTIENLTTSTAASSFPVNKWGYRLTQDSTTSSGNYGVFTPSSNTPVMQSSGPINEKVATMGFGAKIDYMKPSGLYQLNLNFKAVPTVTTNYMQNMDPAICTTDPTVVIDQRDENAYLIQRLDDGKCWMLDNLQLDLTNETVVNTLTTANTNIDTANDPNALNYLKNGGGTTSDKYATDGLTLSNWTGNVDSYSQPLVSKSGLCDSAINGGTTYACNPNDVPYDHNSIPANSNFGLGSNKVGIYYNYCATSAGTYCYGDAYVAPGSPVGNATSDICPAGWRLPTGGAGGEFQNLCNTINGGACSDPQSMTATSPSSMQYKLSAPISGFFLHGGIWSLGNHGYLWTSTMYSSTHMYRFDSQPSLVRTQFYTGRAYGFPVRCVLNSYS